MKYGASANGELVRRIHFYKDEFEAQYVGGERQKWPNSSLLDFIRSNKAYEIFVFLNHSNGTENKFKGIVPFIGAFVSGVRDVQFAGRMNISFIQDWLPHFHSACMLKMYDVVFEKTGTLNAVMPLVPPSVDAIL